MQGLWRHLSRRAQSKRRSREALRHVLVWYLLLVCGWRAWVWLGTLESSMAWGSWQSWQHKQQIFEARDLLEAAEGKGMEAMGFETWIPDTLGTLCDRAVIRSTSPKVENTFCIPYDREVQALQPGFTSLESISPVRATFSYPWTGVEVSTLPALRGSCVESANPWTWVQFTQQGCFLGNTRQWLCWDPR